MNQKESAQPFFSIVIPTFNRGDLIEKTILTILKQNYTNFELIIVDDGSTDSTSEIVSAIKDERIKYFYKQNKERGAARNFGILEATGEYVTFCDSDDILYPNYLANAFDFINNSKELVSWLHLSYEILSESKRSVAMSINPNNYIFELAKGNPLSCMGVFVKSNVIKVNLFNENRYLSGSEDWELWIRLAAQFPIKVDKRVSSGLVIHKGRSVFATDELKLQLRKFLSIGYAFDETYVQEKFGKYKSLMEAYFNTYISLHLMLDNKHKASFLYLLKGISQNPRCIFESRFLAIFKYFLISIFRITKASGFSKFLHRLHI
jgi:glycosyltransferase involved in cell wall biosynthesis